MIVLHLAEMASPSFNKIELELTNEAARSYPAASDVLLSYRSRSLYPLPFQRETV